MPFDEGLAQHLREALDPLTAYTERRMFGGIAFLVAGHMCVGISGQDLMVRVGPDGHAEALAQPHARPMDFTGKPMKGFVYVSPAGYRTTAQAREWIQRGLRFVNSLPPK